MIERMRLEKMHRLMSKFTTSGETQDKAKAEQFPIRPSDNRELTRRANNSQRSVNCCEVVVKSPASPLPSLWLAEHERRARRKRGALRPPHRPRLRRSLLRLLSLRWVDRVEAGFPLAGGQIMADGLEVREELRLQLISALRTDRGEVLLFAGVGGEVVEFA